MFCKHCGAALHSDADHTGLRFVWKDDLDDANCFHNLVTETSGYNITGLHEAEKR